MLNLEQCTVSEPVKRMLDTMFVQKRVPQALIIEGDHTKTTELARVLASGLVCRSQDNKPCGTCSSCIKARAGSHPDIYLAEGGLTPRSFKVEAIRIYNLRKADVKYICCFVRKVCLRKHKMLC